MSSPAPVISTPRETPSTPASTTRSVQKTVGISGISDLIPEIDCDDNTSTKSETSTIKYGHLSYSEFGSQVRELCSLLWPPRTSEPVEKPFIKRIQKRVADALGLNKETLPSVAPERSSREIILEPMRGGTFNRVIGITTIDEDGTESRMVLRVARGDWAHPEHDATVLQFVQKHAVVEGRVIPIPEVIAYDFTSNNPLNAPYLLQKRIAGFDLESKTRSYPNLTHEQKKLFVRQYCRLLLDLRSIEHPYAGRIDARTDKKGDRIFTVGPFPNEAESDEIVAERATTMPFFKVRDFGAPEETSDDASSCLERPEHQTPNFFLKTQFGREKALELRRRPDLIGNESIEEQLGKVADQMSYYGCFRLYEDEETQPYCLTHYDLDPRNIMVDIQNDGYPKITGVLDWDLAMFAPKWVHCRPPMWIWNWLDGGSEDQRKANDEPPTVEQRELKALFEDCVGDEFKTYAYQTTFRLARQVFRFSLTGIHCNEQDEDAEELIKEWDEFYAKELEALADSETQSRDSEASLEDANEGTAGDERNQGVDEIPVKGDQDTNSLKDERVEIEASPEGHLVSESTPKALVMIDPGTLDD